MNSSQGNNNNTLDNLDNNQQDLTQISLDNEQQDLAKVSLDNVQQDLAKISLDNEQQDLAKITLDIERSIIKRYRKSIWRRFTKAVNDYKLIEDGDKIAVCISGGKDSMLMAKLLQEMKRHGKNNFELEFIIMNPGYNEENWQLILHNAKILGIPLTVFESDIFDVVTNVGGNPCYLCARMRRGCLYSKAKELGCNKIALGHHFDDVVETILIGMFYGSQIETMMPKLHSQNFEGMQLIRPMYLIKEDAIKLWRDYNNLHFIQCACRFTEAIAQSKNSADVVNPSKRQEIKELIAKLKETHSSIDMNIFNSVSNVNLNKITGYKKDGVWHNFLDEY